MCISQNGSRPSGNLPYFNRRIIKTVPKFVQEELYDHHNISRKLYDVNLHLLRPPKVSRSLNTTRLGIGNLTRQTTSCGPTHPNKTIVTLVSIVRASETIPWMTRGATDQTITVVVGDVLVYLLEAKDADGQDKTAGGDYWHARMKDVNGTASTVGRVLDHDNGRYTLCFVAAWGGMIRLHITLVHPAEFARWLLTEYLHYWRGPPSWSGLFQVGNQSEKSPCYISPDAIWTNKCVIMNNNALRYTRLICNPPKTLPCDALTGLYSTSKYTQDLLKRLPKARKQFLKSPYLYGEIQNVPEDIFIKADSENKGHLLSDESLDLPSCQPDMPVPLTEGYWWNSTWFSLTCGPRIPLTKTAVQECLHGFNVYFLGDSTTRQWFAAFTEVLGLGRPEDHERVFTLQRHDNESNLNLSFIFHPLTSHPKYVFVNFSTVRFEADVILDLPDDCKNVVVFSPWAHFCLWQWTAYTDWLKGIRAAILVAKQKCPDLIVVAKSPHPVNKQTSMPGRDCLFDEMRRQIRDIFDGVGVIFLDIWDMDLTSPLPINLHMPSDVINQEVSMLLSYICPLINNVRKEQPL